MKNNLRYIAVSATVPNLQDIATWLKAKRESYFDKNDYKKNVRRNRSFCLFV